MVTVRLASPTGWSQHRVATVVNPPVVGLTAGREHKRWLSPGRQTPMHPACRRNPRTVNHLHRGHNLWEVPSLNLWHHWMTNWTHLPNGSAVLKNHEVTHR